MPRRSVDEALDVAVAAFHNQAGLAAFLKITQQSITNWRARGHVPIRRALVIEKALGGKVSAEELCPIETCFGNGRVA